MSSKPVKPMKSTKPTKLGQPTMTPVRAIVTVFRKYVSFPGRAGLAEFWWFMLFSAVVGVAVRATDGLIAGRLDAIELLFLPVYGLFSGRAVLLLGPVASAWALLIMLPTIALFVRRLRDGGSSWLQLLWFFVPVAGAVILILRFCDPSVASDAGRDARRDATNDNAIGGSGHDVSRLDAPN